MIIMLPYIVMGDDGVVIKEAADTICRSILTYKTQTVTSVEIQRTQY